MGKRGCERSLSLTCQPASIHRRIGGTAEVCSGRRKTCSKYSETNRRGRRCHAATHMGAGACAAWLAAATTPGTACHPHVCPAVPSQRASSWLHVWHQEGSPVICCQTTHLAGEHPIPTSTTSTRASHTPGEPGHCATHAQQPAFCERLRGVPTSHHRLGSLIDPRPLPTTTRMRHTPKPYQTSMQTASDTSLPARRSAYRGDPTRRCSSTLANPRAGGQTLTG